MNKILIPILLTATVIITGFFAFMPVHEATTVHEIIIAGSKAGGFDSIVLQSALTLNVNAERFVLFDLHESVEDGFVVIRTEAAVACTELRVVAIGTDGTIEASTVMAELVGAAEIDDPFNNICHGHIPSDADTILIALAVIPDHVQTLPAGTVITFTITELE